MTKKILLLDDDHELVWLVTTLLKLEGHQVLGLPDGLGSLQDVLTAEKPDSLLLDLFLGDRNGLEIIREIRSAGGAPHLQIIVVSGMDQRAESLAAGADAFLLKPFMPDELLELLGK